jgi:hypothetical protein
VTRDYSKFLNDEGLLSTRLIPRPVYVEMVNRWQARPDVIEQVLGDTFWLWDLRKARENAAREGRDASDGELLREIMGEMDDTDWWKLTEAFEQHLRREFANAPEYWSDLLDPVYDAQETDGWIRRQ